LHPCRAPPPDHRAPAQQDAASHRRQGAGRGGGQRGCPHMSRLLDHLRAYGENLAVLKDSQQLSYHQPTDTVTDAARELGGPRRLVLIETRNELGTLVHYVAAMAARHVVLPVVVGREHTRM